MDNELFELCKLVYKHFPSWWQGLDRIYSNGATRHPWDDNFLPFKVEAPLYTSDYLLGKLPEHLDNGEVNWLDLSVELDKGWCVMYEYAGSEYEGEGYVCVAETPLKALLKLVLTLDRAGIKL